MRQVRHFAAEKRSLAFSWADQGFLEAVATLLAAVRPRAEGVGTRLSFGLGRLAPNAIVELWALRTSP